MKLYNSTQLDLTTTAGSFNALLKDALVPLGWSVVDESGFTLQIANQSGYIAKIKDVTNKVYLTGLRSSTDVLGFPTRNQLLVDGVTGVVGSRQTTTDWVLFADETTFYFVLNNELLAFGSYTPMFAGDEKTHFVIGNQYYLGNQTLIVTPDKLTTMLFLEGTLGQFSFSRNAGMSLPWTIDSYKKNSVPEAMVFACPIAIHENTTMIRGFLPQLFAFNSAFTHQGYIYSQGGFKLFCVFIDSRLYGVNIND